MKMTKKIFLYSFGFLGSNCGTTEQSSRRTQPVIANSEDSKRDEVNNDSSKEGKSDQIENENSIIIEEPKKEDGELPAIQNGFVFPNTTWDAKKPSELCNNASNFDQFISRVGGSGVIVKNGYMIKSWGVDKGGDWGSAVKPIFSTMLFKAITIGKVEGVDEKISKYWPNLSGKDADITWAHLANMTSGYGRGEKPGSAWAYNDVAIKLYYLTLFEKVFQTKDPNNVLSDHFSELQFEGKMFGSVSSGDRLMATAKDFARIGWLWLNKGRWKDKQIIPKSFFDNYMKVSVPANMPRTSSNGNDSLKIGSYGGGTDQTHYGPGVYGFNWWFNDGKIAFPNAPADIIQANGHGNLEVLTIFPSIGLVVAARANWGKYEMGTANGDMNKNLQLLSEACK